MGRSKYSRMDKLVYHDALEALTNLKAKIFDITKIDADSVPAAYLKSCKISITDNTSSTSNQSYSFYAALDDGITIDEDRIIDHVVIGPGGGTAWLNINRKIWHQNDGEVGGPVTIWAECSATADSVTITATAYSQRAKLTKV